MPASWKPALKTSDLPDGKGKLVRIDGKTIALFKTGDDFFATDNQCPHEGYPLTEGSIQDGILTCNWHNWKFKLENGSCVFGGEDVRTYPVEIREGTLYVNIQDAPPEVAILSRQASLVAALDDMDTPRMARDVVRLLKMDTSPEDILIEVAAYGADRAEYGWNHALAVLTDCAGVARKRDGLHRALPLTQACRAISEENLRLPSRPHAEAVSVRSYDSSQAIFHALRDAVEKDRLEEAEGLFRGAVAAGVPRSDLETWLYTLATDHFLSFGHALIYATKAFEMLDVLGDRVLTEVTPTLIPEIHYATREDLLPYMRGFMKSLNGVSAELQTQTEHQQGGTPGALEADVFRTTLLDGSSAETFAATYEALDRGVPVDALLDAVVLAASERMLRFDPAKDWQADADYNWLQTTHNLTYANAARKAFRAAPTPDVLRAVYFSAWFVNRTRKLDLPPDKRLNNVSSAEPTTREDVARAITSHDDAGAVSAARRLLNSPDGHRSLAELLVQLSLEDRASAQIYVDHLIKTSVAAAEESRRLAGSAGWELPLLATTRFFAADRRERGVHRQVELAIDFVEHGKPSETV